MTLTTSDLHRQAQAQLEKAHQPNRLVLLHSAISLGATLLVTFLNYLFSRQIAGTGGLGGMDTRSALATAQSVLELAVMVALPFWEIGLIRAAICWTRNEHADVSTLLTGFRRFGPVLRKNIFQGGMFIALAMALLYFSTTVYMLTPFSRGLMELMAPIYEAPDPQALFTEAFVAQMGRAVLPIVGIFGVLYAVVAIPLFYRVRFSDFFVMDGKSAVNSIVESIRATHGNAWKIFRLDLSFWWFYLLQLLCVAVTYGDSLLALAGVSLPISADAAFFLFYGLGVVCQLLLLWRYQAKVSTAYAVAWQDMRTLPASTPVTAANMPWDM